MISLLSPSLQWATMAWSNCEVYVVTISDISGQYHPSSSPDQWSQSWCWSWSTAITDSLLSDQEQSPYCKDLTCLPSNALWKTFIFLYLQKLNTLPSKVICRKEAQMIWDIKKSSRVWSTFSPVIFSMIWWIFSSCYILPWIHLFSFNWKLILLKYQQN